MHFDGWNTIEGRHLVFAYTTIFLVQGGYILWMVRSWLKLGQAAGEPRKKRRD